MEVIQLFNYFYPSMEVIQLFYSFCPFHVGYPTVLFFVSFFGSYQTVLFFYPFFGSYPTALFFLSLSWMLSNCSILFILSLEVIQLFYFFSCHGGYPTFLLFLSYSLVPPGARIGRASPPPRAPAWWGRRGPGIPGLHSGRVAHSQPCEAQWGIGDQEVEYLVGGAISRWHHSGAP